MAIRLHDNYDNDLIHILKILELKMFRAAETSQMGWTKMSK